MPPEQPEGWRERHDAARRDQENAARLMREATHARALALLDGIAELGGPPPEYRGGKSAVARELGISRASVGQTINAHRTGHQDGTTSEST